VDFSAKQSTALDARGFDFLEPHIHGPLQVETKRVLQTGSLDRLIDLFGKHGGGGWGWAKKERREGKEGEEFAGVGPHAGDILIHTNGLGGSFASDPFALRHRLEGCVREHHRVVEEKGIVLLALVGFEPGINHDVRQVILVREVLKVRLMLG